MSEIFLRSESYQILSCCFRVHNQLGSGFLEGVYQEALEISFQKMNIPYLREKKLEIEFEGIKLKKWYKADFICFNQIIIEVKSTQFITQADQSQLNNYLKATNLPLGLIINFGTSKVISKRIINPSALPPL